VISDAERRLLAEIEMVLRCDDPAFVRRFEERRRTPRRRRILARLAILVVLAVTTAALALCGAATVVIGLSIMGCVGVALCLWRRRAQPPRRLR